jgi:regulatory protein
LKTQPFPGSISVIVAQERVKRHLGARANVFIDGKFSFALSLDVIYKYGLKPGMLIDAEKLASLLREDGEAKALTTAANFIGYRPRSKAEVRTRLEKDEWSEEVIARVLERLEAAKMLGDAEFATAWVGARERSKPRGSRLLAQELRQKGIAKEEIEAALPDADAEIENALAALAKLERKLAPYTGRDREQKAIEHMTRRGFGYSVIKAALRRESEASEEEND